MLPRWHILLGAIFTLIFWLVAPETSKIYLAFLFLSSFLIDFDHYVCAVHKGRSASLNKAVDYHKEDQKIAEGEYKKGIRRKGDFHLFHTVEFHLFVGILGLFWNIFFYIFIGMVFHSLIDVYDMAKGDKLYRREFFFFNWLREKI